MKLEREYFEIFPLIVPADTETTITIRGLFDHCRFRDGAEYEVTYYPKEYWDDHSRRKTFTVRAQGDALVIPHHFQEEQEHVFHITEDVDNGQKPIGTFYVYSLYSDLFSRRPYKGDVHMHSYYSDGRESPAYVAASCRKVGFDFMALTDHHRYAPSLEAKAAYQEVDIDLRIFPGEEVHPPECHTHIVNFGGSFSVNELFKNDEQYRREINGLIDELSPLPPRVDPYQYAAVFWTFEKIREAKGLGILCHPHWVADRRYNIPQPLLDYIFEQQPFDAFEVLGGVPVEDNNVQVTYYNDQRARGKQIPIVGVSDSHGCHQRDQFGHFGDVYTLVYSPSLELQDIISSITALYSVAMEIMPGEEPRVYGPFRLVKFARFLLREYMPYHDPLCYAEGNHMLAFSAGDREAAHRLAACKGQVDKLNKKLWAK
ncbi:MAG: hypothetical protein GX322_09830 [Firmicutes bacterium]|nr:hypothetical protein [Bacillota bacterium]